MKLMLMPNPQSVTAKTVMATLLAEAKAQKLTPAILSREARISYSIAYRTLHGATPKLAVALKLAEVLGFHVELQMCLEPGERKGRAWG